MIFDLFFFVNVTFYTARSITCLQNSSLGHFSKTMDCSMQNGFIINNNLILDIFYRSQTVNNT